MDLLLFPNLNRINFGTQTEGNCMKHSMRVNSNRDKIDKAMF